jgi:hypothetical protein
MNEQTPHSEIERRLEELKDVPVRDPRQSARGRAIFLSEAAKYGEAVSPGTNVRQKGWTFLINRKEKFAMNALISLALATALILGGGATAVAAQDDLPNQPLYQVKLMTENAALAMTGDPQLQANMLMNMAQTRVEEMAALAEEGVTPPDQVRVRLQEQLQQTLKLAADMDDATLTQTLLQLRDRLHTQDRILQQLQTHVDAETDPLLTQTRQMLQDCLRLVDDGLADPQGFRYAMTNQMRYGQNEEATPEPNQQGEPGFHHNEEAGQSSEEPGAGIGSGNGASNGSQNPDNGQNGKSGNESGNDSSGGGKTGNSQGGSCSGSDCDGGNGGGGNCSGCGGGNNGGGNK